MPQPAAPPSSSHNAFRIPLSDTAISRAMLAVQTAAIPLAIWLKPVCAAVALAWFIYRAYDVLNKPLDELAALLGFDIPLAPTIDVAGIKADGAVIHWSLPQKQRHKSTLRFDIHLNGTVIDTVSISESAVTISGLQPRSSYVVRVALVNNLDFSSRSEPIRFRTKSAASGDFFLPLAQRHDTEHDGSTDTLPRVRHYRGLKDILPPSIELTPMAREGSVGVPSKRAPTGRRLSPATAGDARTDNDEADVCDGAQTMHQLTERLDAIRRETDDIEGMAKDEEEEEQRLKDELAKERDDLKAEVTEKEKGSRNLKREVNILERQNTAAQNERSKQERLLQQKKQERQRLQDDMVRWEREAAEMKADLERIRLEKIAHLEQAEEAKESLRSRHVDEAAATRTIDDEIREKTAEIKKLERAMKNESPDGTDPEPSLVQQFQQEAEEDRQWVAHRLYLGQQYALAVQKLEATKVFYAEQARYLESLRTDRRVQDGLAAHNVPASPVPAERLPRRADSQRSRQNTTTQSSDSPRLANFPVTSGPFGGGITSLAPFGVSGPYLNIHNGMTIHGPTDETSIADEERERLTGGALMSPGAGVALLPADLFSGDGERHDAQRVSPLPGLGALPGLAGLPGAGSAQPATEIGPASPTSNGSRSPSVFASPRTSSHNLQLGSPENAFMDSDRRSIRSTHSNRATSGGAQSHGSRFSSMFGIKQKNKASAEDGLGLGKVQSHSMPRQDGNLIGLDNARKRNSSISGFGSDAASDALIDAPSGPRRSAFGAFFDRHKNDGWPSTFTSFGRRPASPRPGSTHSTELPRPSMESSRWALDTWPSGDASAGARGSPLSFGPGFGSSAQQQRLFGSRHPSRRPSVQYGGTGPPEDILEDETSDIWDTPGKRMLAPIGTRPATGSQKEAEDNPAKLNPAAKDFKSLFSSRRGKDKSKGDKSALSTPVTGASARDFEMEESPPKSRKSRDTRDTRSFTGTESSVAESGRNSQELIRTPSYSNSFEATAASPHVGSIGKESLMAKISRKSSSSKFSLPTFKRDKGRLDPSSAASSPAIPPPTTEDDEDSLSTSMSSLRERDTRESRESTRGSGRNWGSVLKLGKSKKGNETRSLNSMASADDDDDDT